MKKVLQSMLLVVGFCFLLAFALNASKEACTPESLRDGFYARKERGEPLTDLQSQHWWAGCPEESRVAAYAMLFPQVAVTPTDTASGVSMPLPIADLLQTIGF